MSDTDSLRSLAANIEEAARDHPAYSAGHEIIRNCVDHLCAVARTHELTHRQPAPDREALREKFARIIESQEFDFDAVRYIGRNAKQVAECKADAILSLYPASTESEVVPDAAKTPASGNNARPVSLTAGGPVITDKMLSAYFEALEKFDDTGMDTAERVIGRARAALEAAFLADIPSPATGEFVWVKCDPDILFLDRLQHIFSEYVLESGEFTISRDEALEIWNKLLAATPPAPLPDSGALPQRESLINAITGLQIMIDQYGMTNTLDRGDAAMIADALRSKFHAVPNTAAADMRERCEKIIEEWTSIGTMKLRAGEMTMQEARTAQAILSSILDSIRALTPGRE